MLLPNKIDLGLPPLGMLKILVVMIANMLHFLNLKFIGLLQTQALVGWKCSKMDLYYDWCIIYFLESVSWNLNGFELIVGPKKWRNNYHLHNIFLHKYTIYVKYIYIWRQITFKNTLSIWRKIQRKNYWRINRKRKKKSFNEKNHFGKKSIQ